MFFNRRASTARSASFFSWLGVVPYLTEPVIFSTLRFIAQLAGGAEVMFDYVNPAASVAPAGRAAHQALAERVAAMGERIQSYFDTAPLCAQMSAAGFRRVDDIGPAEIAMRFFPEAVQSAPAAWRARHARLNDLGARCRASRIFARQILHFASTRERQLTMKSPG